MGTSRTRAPRNQFDIEGHAYFLTFSCYNRRSLLERDRCKRIVLGTLNQVAPQNKTGVVGFCIMPNHVHTLVRPFETGSLSRFIQQWKQQSSVQIIRFLHLGQEDDFSPFGKGLLDKAGNVHVWQPKSYCFNVFSIEKAAEKLTYMHNNPVRSGLVQDPCEWPWSSAAYWLRGAKPSIRIEAIDGPLSFTRDAGNSGEQGGR